MTYKSLTDASRELIKKTSARAQVADLKSGKCKQFRVYGDAEEIDYIRETMRTIKHSGMSHREALYIICKKFREKSNG